MKLNFSSFISNWIKKNIYLLGSTNSSAMASSRSLPRDSSSRSSCSLETALSSFFSSCFSSIICQPEDPDESPASSSSASTSISTSTSSSSPPSSSSAFLSTLLGKCCYRLQDLQNSAFYVHLVDKYCTFTLMNKAQLQVMTRLMVSWKNVN